MHLHPTLLLTHKSYDQIAALSTTELLFFDRSKLWLGCVRRDLWTISFVATVVRANPEPAAQDRALLGRQLRRRPP